MLKNKVSEVLLFLSVHSIFGVSMLTTVVLLDIFSSEWKYRLAKIAKRQNAFSHL